MLAFIIIMMPIIAFMATCTRRVRGWRGKLADFSASDSVDVQVSLGMAGDVVKDEGTRSGLRLGRGALVRRSRSTAPYSLGRSRYGRAENGGRALVHPRKRRRGRLSGLSNWNVLNT